MLFSSASLFARPGYSKPVDVKQPDGTTVTLMMRGDEYLSFMTTTDGFTVVKGSDGFYRYAQKSDDGKLVETNIVAKNPAERTSAETMFLSSQKKSIAPKMTKEALEFKQSVSKMTDNPLLGRMENSAAGKNRAIWNRIDYSKFKGLVILVEWNDKKFLSSDPQSFYQKLVNQENYTDDTKTNYPVNVEGSVKDYFYQNSMGVFKPTFDVVGPVTINRSCYYPWPKKNGQINPQYNSNMINILKDVMNAVNNDVDFSEYDLDNNGHIDMVYIIFAGYGSYVQGNNEKYLWPHANDYTSYASWYGLRWDNKYFGRYACSVEIQDYEGYADQHKNLDGIGTMCHEFSHVLGLADHYDTDYEESGGESRHPGEWDVMAGGADHNYGLTPVGYSSYERYNLGFTELQTIDVAGNYELEPFNTSNKFYMLKTGTKDEVFYIENRQNQGWDRFLPGHGMLIWRVDETNPQIWQHNEVNVNPSRLYLELLSSRADKDINNAYSAFPGASGTIDITSTGTPALRSFQGPAAAFDLYDITETTDGKITFKAGKDLYQTVIEDFESTPVTTADATDLNGKLFKWNLTNALISDQNSHVLQLKRNGTAESSVLDKKIRYFSLKLNNGAQKIRFTVNYRANADDKWKPLKTSDGKTAVEIAKNSSDVELRYVQPVEAGCQLQFLMQSTSSSASSAVAYIDDIVFSVADVTETGITDVKYSGINDASIYNLSGQKVNANYKGVVIKDGKKILVK